MAQGYLGQIADTAAESGDDLAARLNAFDSAHKTNQSGATRPANIAPGGLWSREVSSGVFEVMLFDGSTDRRVRAAVSGGDGIAVTNPGGEPRVAVNDTVARRDVDNDFTVPQTVQTAVNVRAAASGNAHYWLRNADGSNPTGLVYANGPQRFIALRAYAANGQDYAEARLRLDGVFEASAFAGDGSGLTGIPGLGVGQAWQLPVRSGNTNYQNNSGRPIQVVVGLGSDRSGTVRVGASLNSMVAIYASTAWDRAPFSFIVPAGHFYRFHTDGSPLFVWSELR